MKKATAGSGSSLRSWCAIRSDEYIALLRQHGAICSMSRVGNPYDNAICESFLKTLKQEEIYCMITWILKTCVVMAVLPSDGYYNSKRLHSALGYVASCLRGGHQPQR